MLEPRASTRIWIVAGVTDLRRGFTGLSAVVQMALNRLRSRVRRSSSEGRRGHLIKVLWWDGDGLCPFQKRLERGRFIWSQATSGSVSLRFNKIRGENEPRTAFPFFVVYKRTACNASMM